MFYTTTHECVLRCQTIILKRKTHVDETNIMLRQYVKFYQHAPLNPKP